MVEVFNIPNYTLEQKLLESGKPMTSDTTRQELFGFQSDLMVDDQIISDYMRDEVIDFSGGNYTAMEGIITFRGNNYRNSAVFGTAHIVDKKFDRSKTWNIDTGKLKKTVSSKGYWLGSCWTGQPLIVRWKDETRKEMNMYEDKKNKEGLVEVIYSTADGYIYFLDLDDGKPTRDKIYLGFPIKGTGSIYPSEVPLYFAGAGDSMGEDCARTFIVDLIQGKVIYEYGYDDEFSLRTDNNKFHGYDSSPLIDVATDTVIQPGENGIIYTMKLNTQYDGKSVSINPEKPVKWRYTTDRSRDDHYWLGMESSASIWKGFLYITDNCGDMFCIDLNTMEVVWVQDTLDDTNASPVLEESMEDGTAYLYISTSLHFTANEKQEGDIPLLKVNAATGEIVWKRSYPCKTVAGVSGGVQATALLGDKKLSGLVYFVVARTGGKDSGKLVALNKYTGETVWSVDMTNYGWSSPIALYDKDENGYVILCDSTGNMYMVDGLSGKLYDTINLGKIIEASPAAFDNTIVVGTKGQKIYGITVK
ncbi:outer membrane protein assembly factor BamB family protein [Lachnoclostridium phytofermentans]|nr:PQQ-binding-like beta-propeller repeat protein [Lachnoclostridium phytofermentans]